MIIVCVSLDVGLYKPDSIGFQSSLILLLLLLCEKLLIKDVTIDLSWKCLLEVLLLHLVFVVVAIPTKVLIIVCVVEQIPMTIVKLKSVASVTTHVMMIIWLRPTSIIVRHLYI